MYITPEVADRLLRTAGSSLAAFNQQDAELAPGEIAMTDPGAMLRMQIPVTGTIFGYEDLLETEFTELETIIGYIPGTGADEMLAPGEPMSNQAIIVSAYYDGVGMGLDGTLYPGANDNASGVATMLEIARVLQAADYEPKRTVVFIAWPEGERYQGLSLTDAMNATTYMRNLIPEAVIELSGVGAGTGESIFLAEGTSFRLTQLFQEAANRVGSSTTTRGRGPHYGIPQYLGFGGRSALSAYVHWDGADDTAHTLEDTIAAIDPEKLDQVGQTTLLAVTVLSRERDY